MRGIIDIDNHPINFDLEHDLIDCTFENRCKRLSKTSVIDRKRLIYNINDPDICNVVLNQEIDLKVL